MRKSICFLDLSEREREAYTAGEVFSSRASIPEPMLVPTIQETAPSMVPFFPAPSGSGECRGSSSEVDPALAAVGSV